jgi:methionine-rich copper-binding protein CopC
MSKAVKRVALYFDDRTRPVLLSITGTQAGKVEKKKKKKKKKREKIF